MLWMSGRERGGHGPYHFHSELVSNTIQIFVYDRSALVMQRDLIIREITSTHSGKRVDMQGATCRIRM